MTTNEGHHQGLSKLLARAYLRAGNLPLAMDGNSVRLEICHGQRFMVVDLRAGCQYGQRTAKLTVWLGGGLRRDWSWGRHVEAQNDHDSAEHKTPRPVQQSTGRCLGEHGN